MSDDKMFEVKDDSLGESDGDKTPEENEDLKKELDELPSEDDLEGDKKKEPEKKVDRSEVAQKIKYREKLRETEGELAEANEKIAKLEERIGTKAEKPSDEKELEAQKYIRNLARKEAEAMLAEREAKEKKVVKEFEAKVEEVLEDNPDITEEKLLDVVEKFNVEPKVAVAILKEWEEKKKPGPKMPAPKRSTTATPSKKTDDSKKSMFQVAQDVIREYKDKITG